MQSLSTASAFIAAVLWFWSASIQLPKQITIGYGGVGGTAQLMGDKLRSQSRLSAFAAFFAGLSALFQAMAPYFSHHS